jgi:hypothetical protein
MNLSPGRAQVGTKSDEHGSAGPSPRVSRGWYPPFLHEGPGLRETAVTTRGLPATKVSATGQTMREVVPMRAGR